MRGVEASRNFANKVWNASRFIQMNMEGKTVPENAWEHLQPVDKWILSRLNSVVKEVTDNMENFELGIAVQKVYDFIWDEFCDWYIEMVKPQTARYGRRGQPERRALDAEKCAVKRPEAAASLHALRHRRDLLQPAG